MLAHLPSRRTDQVLTSWLLLLCRNHGSQPHTFGQLLWPGIPIWTRDFDRTVSDRALEAISRVTGVSIKDLSSMTLRDMIRRSNQAERIKGRQAGVLPVGVYHRVRKAFGQQYCLVCLDQSFPYLKREWRSEFAVACRDHLILLSDACPHCDTPFVPHRNQSMLRAICHRCSGSLTSQTAVRATPQALRLQHAVALCLGMAQPTESDQSNSSLRALGHSDGDLLDGLRRLCRLRASVQGQETLGSGHREWSSLRTAERAVVLDAVANHLANWPQAWIEWANVEGLTQHALTAGFGLWPSWIRDAMAQLPYSFGPTGFRRARDVAPLRRLRRCAPSLLEYRRGRAKLLLREAMSVKDALA